MEYLSLFRMPTPMKITGRSSSITNAFINSIIPVVAPRAEEVKQALEILGMTPGTFQCAYCGSVASESDHLRPLVKDKKPTGYISEIHNLVPSCGKCNQSRATRNGKPGCTAPQDYLQPHAVSKTSQNESSDWMLTRIPRLRQKWISRPS